MAFRTAPDYTKIARSRHRTGLSYRPYTFLPFHGLYTEDGYLLRGTEGEAKSSVTPIPAPALAIKGNCCGKLGLP